MSRWITPTDKDVMAANSAERTSIVAAKGGNDDLPEIVKEVVETFRDAIRNGGQQLDVAGTVPLGVKQSVIEMALWLFVTRGMMSNGDLQTKQRQDMYERSLKLLERITSGEFKVIPVDDTQSIANSVEVARPGRKVRTDMFDSFGST